MMINCEKASKLTSKKTDQKLSFIERLVLKFHTLMCSTCALFEVESEILTKSLENKYSKEDTLKISDDMKNKLKKLINEN